MHYFLNPDGESYTNEKNEWHDKKVIGTLNVYGDEDLVYEFMESKGGNAWGICKDNQKIARMYTARMLMV